MPKRVDIHAMNLGELETEVLKKLWIQTGEDSNGFAADTAFIKYSRYRVQKKINKAYTDLVVMSKVLKSWFIITLKQYYSQYSVPPNCFDIDAVFYFSSSTSYTQLDMYEESIIESDLLPGWRTVSGTPQYAYVANRNKMQIKLGIAPAPSTDGTSPTLGATAYNRATPYGTLEAVSGSAGVGSSGLVYIDSHGQNFQTLGVVIGETIYNISDGSSGVITNISTTNTAYDTITCTTITGGSLNTWTPGDEMKILYGEYGNLITMPSEEAQFLLSPSTGIFPTPGITMAAGNLLVCGYMQPILLRDKYQYPELSPPFHQAIAIGAAAELGSEEPVDSPEFTQAQAYKAAFQEAVAGLNVFSSMQYKSGTVQLWSKR